MTPRHRVMLVAVAMLAVAGCGSDKPDAEKESPAAKPSASQETSDEETSEQDETPTGPVKLGETLAAGDWGKVTVKKINPNVTTDPESMTIEDATRWSGALVRTCVNDDYTDEDVLLAWSPWSMADNKSGTFLSSSLSGSVNFPKPMYPQLGDRTTRPGSCAEGWIVFNTSGADKLTEVIYESSSVDDPLVWQVG